MKKLGMNALLGVGQGSRAREPLVVMHWNGGKKADAPVAFVGKGVCFDTGGISIKPAAGMEDMKGDMAGAACVTGLMQALAARKAQGQRGRRHRPGREHAGRQRAASRRHRRPRCRARPSRSSTPTPKAASCWPTCSGTRQQRFKPKFMVDLATLTGAIVVALGQEYAGMFSNDDELAERLTKAGPAHRRTGLAHAAGARLRQDDQFQDSPT